MKRRRTSRMYSVACIALSCVMTFSMCSLPALAYADVGSAEETTQTVTLPAGEDVSTEATIAATDISSTTAPAEETTEPAIDTTTDATTGTTEETTEPVVDVDEGTGTTVETDAQETPPPTQTDEGDATLVPATVGISPQADTYTVVFSANGGSGTMASQTIDSGVATNLTANAFVPGADNRRFVGWNTEAAGTGTAYTDTQAVTDIAAAGGSITLYAQWQDEHALLFTDGTMIVKYGDATTDETTAHGAVTNTYALTWAGIYPAWTSTSGNSTITRVIIADTWKIQADASHAFYKLENLTSIEGMRSLDTSAVTDMNGMFYSCSSLTSLDLSLFNTAAVTDMGGMFRSCSSLTSLDLSTYDISSVTTMSAMFNECSSLTSLTFPSTLDTSSVTTMSSMFSRCSSLTSLTFPSTLDTSSVTTMYAMFYGCSALTSLDISSLDTVKVTDMSSMFGGCTSLATLTLSSTFDTAAVTDMAAMFKDCSALSSLDLSSFNTANVAHMSNMFDGCSALSSLDISTFNTTASTAMSAMFSGCSNLTSMRFGAGFKVRTNASAVFPTPTRTANGGASTGTWGLDSTTAATTYSATELATLGTTAGNLACTWYAQAQLADNALLFSDGTMIVKYGDATTDEITAHGAVTNTYALTWEGSYPAWTSSSGNTAIKKVIIADPWKLQADASHAFSGLSDMTAIEDLTNLDTAAVTTMNRMFNDCSSLTSLGLSSFSTANVTNMGYMFRNCYALTSLDLSTFVTAKVTDTGGMFYGCKALSSLTFPTTLDTSAVTDTSYMFYSCSSLLSLNLSSFDTTHVTDMNHMFEGCSSLPSLIFPTTFDTSAVTNMMSMFAGCSALTSLDLSRFDTVKVTNMSYMLSGCSLLSSLTLSTTLNTSAVKNMGFMFRNCSSLTSLDLSTFNTTGVTNMNQMFYGCSSLTSLDLSTFDTAKVTDMSYMVYGCTNLTTMKFGSAFKVATTNTNMFSAPTKSINGKPSIGTWGLGSVQVASDADYTPAALATYGTTAGNLNGTWYAQEEWYTVTIPTTITYTGMNVGTINTATTYDVTLDGNISGTVSVGGSTATMNPAVASSGTLTAVAASATTAIVFSDAGTQIDTTTITGDVDVSDTWTGTIGYTVTHS